MSPTVPDRVKDEETLFRRVLSGKNLYTVQSGKLRLSSQAFADRKREPSVVRAALCNNDPSWAQQDDHDGVVSLVAIDVRQISVSGLHKEKAPTVQKEIQYNIDVVPRPLEANQAHAVICPTPPYRTNSVFRRVREALVLLASRRNWTIPPVDMRNMN